MPRRRSTLVLASFGLATAVAALALALNGGHQAVGLADDLGWRDLRTPALAARESQVVQRRIAACMAALGLVYREFVEPPLEVPDAELGPREWAAKWGFGVTTSVGVAAPLPAVADPNLAYIDGLPPDRRGTYRAALFGTASSPVCNADATETVYGRHDRLLAGLAPALADLERRIASDPRGMEADAIWQACV